jgi:TolA-binding protein
VTSEIEGIHHFDKKKSEIKQNEIIFKEFYDKALSYFYMIPQYYPKSTYLSKAYYEIGHLEFKTNNFEKSKDAFLKFVNLEENKNEDKFSALLTLARISIDEKDFKNGLIYLNQAKENPEPSVTCGYKEELESMRKE